MKKKSALKIKEHGLIRIPIRKLSDSEREKILAVAHPSHTVVSEFKILDFKKSFSLPCIIIALIVGMNWSGLWAVGETLAYYNDIESSDENAFAAASLDFSLSAPTNFAPDVVPDDDAFRTVNVSNDGSLGFDYSVSASNFSGDLDLCAALDVTASLDGGAGITEPLNTFDIGPFAFGDPEDWDFTATLTSSNTSLQNKSCAFDFDFDGEQSGGAGFSDTETISNVVESGAWVVDACVTEPGDIISTVMTGSSFGTNGHNLIVASGGELKSPTSGGSNGDITVSTNCDVTVQSGGKITAVKGDGTGGTMTISARNFTVDVGGIVSASSTASGKKGGMATVTTIGDFTVNGTFSANGHDDGGTIIVDSNDDISVSGSSLTATSANKDGGDIMLSADDDITVTGLVSASAKDEGGTIVILAGGDLSVPAGGSVLAESTNKKGGRIEAVIDGISDISGTLSVDGKDGDGLVVMSVQDDMTVSGTGLISANSTGSGKDGGTIGIKVGGDALYSGTVRANATKNAKIIALWSEGTTAIGGTAGKMVSATGGTGGVGTGGVIDITTRVDLSGDGTIDASGTVNGSIIQRTVTNSFGGVETPTAITESIILNSIVLNEIIPDPTGDDQGDSAMPLNGEWMELYNKSVVAVDVNGWFLRDADGNILTISAAKGDNDNDLSDAGETIVPAGGTLTVYRNGAGGPTLNDAGDTVQLLTDTSVLIDSFTYVVDVGVGSSIARMPDGTGAWVDPEPTPTALNGGVNIEKLMQEFLERLNAAVVEEVVDYETGLDPLVGLETSQIGGQISDFIADVLEFFDGGTPDESATTIVEEPAEEPVAEVEPTVSEPVAETTTEPEPVREEEFLPTEENNEAPADTSEPIVEAVIPEEERTIEPEVVEETPPAEPENAVTEPPQPADVVEPPPAEPTPEPTI